MTPITLYLEPSLLLFYTRIACTAGKPVEQVLRDSLFKLAGELSLQALQKDGTGNFNLEKTL